MSYTDQEIKFIELCEGYDLPTIIELAAFKYGAEPFKEFLEDQDKFNSEEFDDIKYILQQNGWFDEFVDNWDAFTIEKDENDPFHWRFRKKQMERFSSDWDKISGNKP